MWNTILAARLDSIGSNTYTEIILCWFINYQRHKIGDFQNQLIGYQWINTTIIQEWRWSRWNWINFYLKMQNVSDNLENVQWNFTEQSTQMIVELQFVHHTTTIIGNSNVFELQTASTKVMLWSRFRWLSMTMKIIVSFPVVPSHFSTTQSAALIFISCRLNTWALNFIFSGTSSSNKRRS